MNIVQAAQALGVHPNTVYARLQRIFDISGLQARSFNALTDLLIVCDCNRHGAVGISVAGGQSLPSDRRSSR
jgi:sugar diacid utilization regulator